MRAIIILPDLQVLLCRLVDMLDAAVPWDCGRKYDLEAGGPRRIRGLNPTNARNHDGLLSSFRRGACNERAV